MLDRVKERAQSLGGRELGFIEYRQAWGEDREYFLDSSGQLQRLLALWTDLVGEDPFVAVSTGRSPPRVNAFVAPLKKVADPPPSTIENLGVDPVEASHSPTQIRLRGFDQEVEESARSGEYPWPKQSVKPSRT